MPTVLITGANRGLGLELSCQYAADGWSVVATSRKPSDELAQLGVETAQFDVADLDAVERFGRGFDRPLDLLIANAGTWGPMRIESAADGREWAAALTVNSIAPVLLAETLMPRLSEAKGTAIAITSKMGSIDDNGSGGYVAYRSSKSALNSAWRSLALDHRAKGVIAAVLHPGWVQTRMGGNNAPLTVEQSVSAMRQTIERLEPNDSGSFLNYDGTPIPW
ncbi:SDR family oxidoreductase [Sphingomonas piscis]|uniref:SDR family oxidoreductase n=1 Tax=Sphingomonas piscis TaxID=2714943 RepID=A0A6G7YPS1_9SPHN|nr:SDR family oxidoreductase [Sphingomonas piscis]QIK78726.1 SDR family oxidoreductase [Sphingomonas piscis]